VTMTARGSKSPAAPGGYSAGALGAAPSPTRRKSRGDAVATSLGAAPSAARAAPAGENAGPNRPAFESDAKSDGATPVPSDRDEEREEERA